MSKHSENNFVKRKRINSCRKNKKKDKPIAKVVAGTLSSIPGNSTVRLPFTTFLFDSTKVNIAPDGGILIEEDGEYFITLSVIFPNTVTTLAFSIFSPDFSGTALTGTGSANYSELVCLRRGDIIYVNVTNTAITPITGTIVGVLTVVKVED